MSKLYFITGFLGAGKTTFLKNVVGELSGQQIHVIVNEFGKEGVDGTLLAKMGAYLDEINNGSIFCSCRLDKFEETLQTALENKPDAILVEASGLSDPSNVRKIISQKDKFSEIEYMGCICLVDAIQFHKVYETATVVKKQIAISDMIMMNKTDLASKEQIETVKELIKKQRPDMVIYETAFGKIKKEWIQSIKAPKLAAEAPDIQTTDITLQKFLLHIHETCTYESLKQFIELFINDTYRIKGFVTLNQKTYLVDCVGSRFQAELYDGETANTNSLVILSGNGLPAKKSIKKAMGLFNDIVSESSPCIF